MKLFVVDPGGEEKLLSFKHQDTTLGTLLVDKLDTIAAAEINGVFTEQWQDHQLQSRDSIRIYCKTTYGWEGFIAAVILSVVSTVLSVLLAPKPKKPNVSKSQPSIGVAGIQNTIAPGTPKFITYGRRRVFGHLIASTIDVVDPIDGDASTGRHMSFSALYYMGVGLINSISEVQINNTNLCDIYGPPEATVRLGTEDQTIILGHEIVHQVYQDGREIEILPRPSASKRDFPEPGRPITYTTKSQEVDACTFFFNFPSGLFAIGVHGARYNNFVGLKILRKLNTDTEWTDLGIFNSIRTKTEFGFFWKLEIDCPSTGQWDFQINQELQDGHGSFGTAPTCALFNVMETRKVVTAYPGNALLEIHGIANDQITGFDQMAASALLEGRLVDVLLNGIYVRQYTRNRVWIVRDLLLDTTVGLGHRLPKSIWDSAAGQNAANYYEESVTGFDDISEQRDFCDVIISETRSGSDHIKNLLFEGRAILLMSQGRYKYTLDRDKPLIPGNYINYSFPGNIIESSLQLERGSSEKPVNTIRGEFADEDQDYKVIPAKLVYPGTESEPERQEQVSFTSIVRHSHASREMNFRLKKLRLIKKRWAWKSPKSAIISEPLDIGKLAYNINKNIRGYNGIINNKFSNTTRLATGKEIYLASGFTYSVHVAHENSVEEKFISNSLGMTHSIINLSSPLSFTPVQGDIWTVGKTVGSVLEVQFDDVESDEDNFILKCHEHIPAVYDDTLTNVTGGENVAGTTVYPRPILDAQVLKQTSITGFTQGVFDVIPIFNTFVGTYSILSGTSIILDPKESTTNDIYNDAYITAEDDGPYKILDYVGSTRQVIIRTPGFLTGITSAGTYKIDWLDFGQFYGFTVAGSTGASGPFSTVGITPSSVLGTHLETSYSENMSASYTHFQFTPYSSNNTQNTNARIVKTVGQTDVTAPIVPILVNSTSDSSRHVQTTVTLFSPLERDTRYVNVTLLGGSLGGTELISVNTDISSLRNENNGLSTLLINAVEDLDTINTPFNTEVFTKVKTIDFFGNESADTLSFNSVILSASEDDGPGDIPIDTNNDPITFTGSTRSTLYSNTIDGGILVGNNAVELDLQLVVTAGSTLSTNLSFYYVFAGTTLSTLTANIANNVSKITNLTPYALSFLLEPDGGLANSQVSTARRSGATMPVSTDPVTDIQDSIADASVDQNIKIVMDINGNLATSVILLSSNLRQIIDTGPGTTDSVPYIISGTIPLVPSAGGTVLLHPILTNSLFTFPANMAGSRGVSNIASTTLSIFNIGLNGVNFGTMRFAAGASVATFINSETTFTAGNILSVTAPSTVDATLSGIGFTLLGNRS